MRISAIFLCFFAVYFLDVYAMGRGSSSRNASNNNAPTMNSIISALGMVETFLSQTQSVVGTLQEQDALKVDTLRVILDTAESSWKPGAIWMVEKVVHYMPAPVTSCLESAAGMYHPQGKEFIQFLIDQDKEGKSVAGFLRAVRYGIRYAVPNSASRNHFLSTNEKYINGILESYHPILPALTVGIKAMHTTLSKSETRRRQQLRSIDDRTRPAIPLLVQWANDDDDDDDQYNPIAEYNRIHKELVPTGHVMNEQEQYLTNSIVDNPLYKEQAHREAEDRDEGMTDWFK